MRHDILLEKFGVRLRPVHENDAIFIMGLRTLPEIKRFIGDTSAQKSDQDVWLQRYFERANDYYFIIENSKSNRAVGTISVYDVENDQAEWGRWIIAPGEMVSAGSVYLIYQVAFDILKLNEVYTRTVSENEKVVSFHNSLGAKIVAVDQEFVNIGNRQFGITRHSVHQTNVGSVMKTLERFAQMAQRFL